MFGIVTTLIGAGAVGCYYGGRLVQHGLDVHFLMRSDFSHVRAHGLTIRSIDGDFFLARPNIYPSSVEIGPCDLVIIAARATALKKVEKLFAVRVDYF